MSARREKVQRDKRSFASDIRINDALSGQPPGSVKRVMRKLPLETNQEAVARAQLMPWWAAVINPEPKGDLRYWVWYCDESNV